MRPDDYHITVKKVSVDGLNLYEARTREFPDLIDYGDNARQARELAHDSIEATLRVLREQGRPIPRPYAGQGDYEENRALTASR